MGHLEIIEGLRKTLEKSVGKVREALKAALRAWQKALVGR